jgi:hypothetical protein
VIVNTWRLLCKMRSMAWRKALRFFTWEGLTRRRFTDPCEGPAEESARLDGHQPVGDFAQRVGRREARDLVIFDSLQEDGTRRSPNGVGLEVVG